MTSVFLAKDYFVPYRSFDDAIAPSVISILGSLSTDEATELIVTGADFSQNAIAILYPEGASYFDHPIIQNIYRTATSLVVPVPQTEAGNYELLVFNEDKASQSKAIKAIAPTTEETTIEEMRSQSILSLLDRDKLTIGNNPAVIEQLDLLYYKNIDIKFNSKGAYINDKGYIIASSIAKPQDEIEKISFVFYAGNDSNYLVFGYVAPETWNLSSNDYNKTEHSFRFRNQRGCYYQHGLFESGRSSTSFVGYVDFDRDYFYRLDLPIDRDVDAQLYRLESGDSKDWLGGKFKQKIEQAQAGDRLGKTLYPFFGNYNRSTSPITGIIVS